MAEVTQQPEDNRYVITVDGETVGLMDYQLDGDVLIAIHTEVDPSFGGQGLGAQLVRAVLDDVRSSGRRVRPVCPFVRHFLREHAEYRDLAEPTGGTDRSP